MATYIPNATQTTEPVESRTVESAALEFRTLKASINGRIEDVQDDLDAEIVNRIAGDANLQTQNNNQDVRIQAIEAALLAIGEGGLPGTVYVQRLSGTGAQTAFTLNVSVPTSALIDIFINGVYQNKDTFTIVDDVLTFSEAPPAGTDNVEVVASITIANVETDASLVSFRATDSSTIVRTVESKLREGVSVKDFGAVGNGVADDTSAVQAAVTHCITTGDQLYWPDGTYLTTATISNFHDIHHVGRGVVSRNSALWYITPNTASEVNTLFVKSGGLTATDGLSEATPTTWAGAFAKLRNWGHATGKGQWRIQVIGTVTFQGVRFTNMPTFAYRLQIFGQRDGSNNITAILDGSTATEAYCFRADEDASQKYLHFKDIQFQNWTPGDENGGGIVAWHNIDVFVEFCKFVNSGRGVWFASGRARVYDCVLEDVFRGTYYQYHCKLNSMRNTYTNTGGVGTAVHLGRLSAGHIRECTFAGHHTNIDATQNCRLRTIYNNHLDWAFTAINLSVGATWESGTGERETFASASMTNATPPVMKVRGAIEAVVDAGTGYTAHTTMTPSLGITVTGTTSPVLVTTETEMSAPLRLPGFFMRQTGNKVKLSIRLSAGAIGDADIVLCGAGMPGSSAEVIRVPWRPAGAGMSGVLDITLISARNGSSTGYAYAELKYGVSSDMTTATVTWDSSGLSNTTWEEILYRLYVVPLSTSASVTIFHIDSEVKSKGY